jgi:hypothetical protein
MMLDPVKGAEGAECFAEGNMQIETSGSGWNWRQGARFLHSQKPPRAKPKCPQQESING